MPELPEVETLRRALERELGGRRLLAVTVADGRLRWPVREDHVARLQQARLTAVRRRGKVLLLAFSGGRSLLLHLGMSGRLLLERAGAATRRELVPLAHQGPSSDRHERVRFLFSGGRLLRFEDPRRFGYIETAATESVAAHPRLAALGPEPEAFDPARAHRSTRGRRTPLKVWLMDARKVAGIGNIYAAEICHRAGLHPALSVGRLGAAGWRTLRDAMLLVLAEAIEAGGTSIRDFQRADGRPGGYTAHLRVYGREGRPCPRCAHAIRRIRQSGRSTFFCPGCQSRGRPNPSAIEELERTARGAG